MQRITRDDHMVLSARGEAAGGEAVCGKAQMGGREGFPLGGQAVEEQRRFREELEQLAPRLLPLAEGRRRSELKLVVFLWLAGGIQFRERGIRDPCLSGVLFRRAKQATDFKASIAYADNQVARVSNQIAGERAENARIEHRNAQPVYLAGRHRHLLTFHDRFLYSSSSALI